MTEPRILATLRGNDDLLAALRARADELDISRTSVDLLAGLTPGLASKFLADPPMRNMSTDTLFGMAAALGGVLILVEDAESLAQVRRRAPKRRMKRVLGDKSGGMLKNRHSRRVLRHFQQAGGLACVAKYGCAYMSAISLRGNRMRKRVLPKARRCEIARHAAVIRWERVRAVAQGERK